MVFESFKNKDVVIQNVALKTNKWSKLTVTTALILSYKNPRQ